MTYYKVIAYRYGHREGHQYVVNTVSSKETAITVAKKEADERGGKYSVIVFFIDDDKVTEIHEEKCPSLYTKNTKPAL